MIKTAFFDINDTLINHSYAQKVAIKKMANILSECDEVEFIRIWKKTTKKYWDLFEKKKITFNQQRIKRIESVWIYFNTKLTYKQMVQYANYYTASYKKALILNPILKVFLDLLQKNNIPIGIISNGHGSLQRSRLKTAGVNSLLTSRLVFISEEIGVAKPDKEIFILAEIAAGVPASNIIFFGDDLKNDIEPAKKRGWKTIWVNGNNGYPDEIL